MSPRRGAYHLVAGHDITSWRRMSSRRGAYHLTAGHDITPRHMSPQCGACRLITKWHIPSGRRGLHRRKRTCINLGKLSRRSASHTITVWFQGMTFITSFFPRKHAKKAQLVINVERALYKRLSNVRLHSKIIWAWEKSSKNSHGLWCAYEGDYYLVEILHVLFLVHELVYKKRRLQRLKILETGGINQSNPKKLVNCK